MTAMPLANTATLAGEARISDFFALLKPKVMSLVVFTGFAGMWLAPGFHSLHPFLAFVGVLCIGVGAGAAGAVNMWYDRDIDAIMRRTRNRPLPQNRIEPSDALALGIALSLISVMLMGLALNWTAAFLLAAANLFYVFIYTFWLKRLTPQNIVIGGAAGAFPPLIGWACVTGNISLFPFILFLIIFFWTPPHFWALSLFSSDDYKAAGIPMLSVVRGSAHTKMQMLAYTLVLLPMSMGPWLMGFASPLYGACAAILGGAFVLAAVRVLRSEDLYYAKIMFSYSIFYLFALFLSLMFLA